MGMLSRLLGRVWDKEQGRYVSPKEHFTAEGGDRRDYGYMIDHRGERVRVGLPGEDKIAPAPRDAIAELAKEWGESESWVRGLYSSDFNFDDD